MATVSRLMFSCLLAASAMAMALAPAVVAQDASRDQVRSIEREYARQNDGKAIPDDQLEYYVDRAQSGWSMDRVGQDMATARGRNRPDAWRPQSGWSARGIICSSERNQYRECQAPFRGRARLDQQVSQAACVEGRSWGQKPGQVWVNHGCRARFIGMATVSAPPAPQASVVCKSLQGRQEVCATGMRGQVALVSRFKNSGACIEGRTWGQRPGQVWVSGNCRARFAAMGRPGPGDDARYDGRSRDDRYSRDDRDDRDDRADRDDRDGRDGGDERDDRWTAERDYSVTCAGANANSQRTRCDWDARYGAPRVAQRLSQAACVEGRSWGYNDREGLWVSEGCRARFVRR
ncbi:DUF3011 domain-containing protein [Arenimonas sp. MALMAid1274]|uniref:DUF3011 domain-containing protein n=1 Tax=Arenimonas sp. MALMAid1274 TaxID=3411630 RepID=UPI003BA3A4A0